jgi:lanthanide-dependent methanol dehydrogenase
LPPPIPAARPLARSSAPRPLAVIPWRRFALALLASACLVGQPQPGAAQSDATGTARDGTWSSAQSEIRLDTIDRLNLLAATSLDSPDGQAGAPGLSGDVLIAQTPFPHDIVGWSPFGSEPRRVWQAKPPADRMARGLQCCTPGQQPSVDGTRAFLVTLDGHAMALETATGAVAWDRQVANVAAGETLALAPATSGGRAYVGSSGDENGARGWIAALDMADGHEIWRRFNTGPDVDVGIGPGFRPALARDRGREGMDRDLGVATWPPSAYEHGGGGVAGAILVDEAGGLVIHGTGHPAPSDPAQRPGDNLWTSGLMARNAANGDARWFVGFNRNDRYGYGGSGPTMLVDRDWQGALRKLVLHADANGLFFVIDRETGTVLSADAYTEVTAHDGYDPATGDLRYRPDKAPRTNRVARGICPAQPGALQGGGAYSASTGFAYLATSRLCMDFEPRRTGFVAGTLYTGANMRLRQPAEGPLGALVAWDVAGRREAWSVREDFPLAGGVLATADLVFYGTLDGQLKALDARTGRLAWTRFLPSGTIAQPVALRGPDGREVIAVLSGLPGPLGQVSDADIDVRDATAANGSAHALSELPKRTGRGAALSVFRLR